MASENNITRRTIEINKPMTPLEKRILDISFKHKLSHIGSNIISVNVIDKIFQVKKSDEPFILSNGHAGLALYVVLEKYGYGDAEELYLKHGTHPNRDLEHHIFATTGSLGHGIGIAVGMAIADKNKSVYVLMSDGECAEGSVWEALRVAGDLRMENLRVAVIANGWGAYGKVDVNDLDRRLNTFYPTMVVRANLYSYPGFLQGQAGHYVTMNEEEYKEALQ